jgi:hypothetical protein
MRLPLLATLALAAGCRTVEPTTPAAVAAANLLGRWEKVEKSLPPVLLELRSTAQGVEGQVWLSGVTYTLPAVLADSIVSLIEPTDATRLVGVLQKDGRLRVTFRGEPPVEAFLVKR